MANTRNLKRDERKMKKRTQRRALKALFGSMTAKERGEWGRSEQSMKSFLKGKGRI